MQLAQGSDVELLGMSREDYDGTCFFLEALSTAHHTAWALGLDRLSRILAGEENIFAKSSLSEKWYCFDLDGKSQLWIKDSSKNCILELKH